MVSHDLGTPIKTWRRKSLQAGKNFLIFKPAHLAVALEIVPAVPVVEFFLIDQGFLGVGVVKDFSRQVRTAVNYRQEGDNPDPAGDQQEQAGLGPGSQCRSSQRKSPLVQACRSPPPLMQRPVTSGKAARGMRQEAKIFHCPALDQAGRVEFAGKVGIKGTGCFFFGQKGGPAYTS